MKNDLTNKRFGKLIIIEDTGKRYRRNVIWKCQCDCGNIIEIRGNSLKSNTTRSCGCLKKEITSKVDITGRKFNKLLALNDTGNRNSSGSVIWLCKCDCGNLHEVSYTCLKNNQVKSCGCLVEEKTVIHGHNRIDNVSLTYKSWSAMKARCSNPNNVKFDLYGGRGIKVCDRWKNSFKNFLEDMGERPKGKTLDRINPDGDYEPFNCRWATNLEQRHNRRNL